MTVTLRATRAVDRHQEKIPFGVVGFACAFPL